MVEDDPCEKIDCIGYATCNRHREDGLHCDDCDHYTPTEILPNEL